MMDCPLKGMADWPSEALIITGDLCREQHCVNSLMSTRQWVSDICSNGNTHVSRSLHVESIQHSFSNVLGAELFACCLLHKTKQTCD